MSLELTFEETAVLLSAVLCYTAHLTNEIKEPEAAIRVAKILTTAQKKLVDYIPESEGHPDS